jgi:hypothetical protein
MVMGGIRFSVTRIPSLVGVSAIEESTSGLGGISEARAEPGVSSIDIKMIMTDEGRRISIL